MKKVYLDNAATTPIHPEVIDLISQEMGDNYGNPSSIHQFGRSAKAKLEATRKMIASHFNIAASTIVFTSGGGEADNLLLHNAVVHLGVQRIISSSIEHHAVVHCLEHLKAVYAIEVINVELDEQGVVNLNHLENLLKSGPKTLISLMHINNEIGNMLNIKRITELSQQYDALFHSDTVQTIGHYALDLTAQPIDFITASAHKFHGPKGVGFAYIKKGIPIKPLLLGGAQERGARAGTENVPNIIGMGLAFQIAMDNLEEEQQRIGLLKAYFSNELVKLDSGIQFNGQSEDQSMSTYTILSVRFPRAIAMLLFQLDLKGIAASGGSACQSGSDKGSHVLHAILSEADQQKTSVRFSFGHYTTTDDIDYTLEVLADILGKA